MKCKFLIFLISLISANLIHSQKFEWLESNTYTNPGERVVAKLEKVSGSYVGLEIIGQVTDMNGNWGYNLPTVANFRMYVKFSGEFKYDLVQDVKTSMIKLGLRKVSDNEIHLVANCPRQHMGMKVCFEKIQGSVKVTMGEPRVVISEPQGKLLMSEPNYTSQPQSEVFIKDPTNSKIKGLYFVPSDNSKRNYIQGFQVAKCSPDYIQIGSHYGSVRFTSKSANNPQENMRILRNGNVGIGTTTPDFKLDVCGTIRAKEIKVEEFTCSNGSFDGTLAANNITVKANGQTADFVFADDYNLKSLSEVENFIKTNKHLPEIPSAEKMEEQGVNLAEMNKLLLQKVEELTLYLIEKDKEVKSLEEEKNKEQEERKGLEVQVKTLIDRLERIETLLK